MKKLLSVMLSFVLFLSGILLVPAAAWDKDTYVAMQTVSGIGSVTATPRSLCENGFHTNVVSNTYTAPTCTQSGYKGGSACLDCGTVFAEPTVIPAVHKSLPSFLASFAGLDADGDGYCDLCGAIVKREPQQTKSGLLDALLALFQRLFG